MLALILFIGLPWAELLRSRRLSYFAIFEIHWEKHRIAF